MPGPDARDDDREMEMIDAYLKHLHDDENATEDTLAGRQRILLRISRELDYGLGRTSHQQLADFLYRDEWSQNTKATYFRAIKSFYDWATAPDDPWLEFNPAARLTRVKTADSVARACTDDELQQILAKAKEPYRTWAILAAYMGLRCIEIARLEREHITREQLIVVKGKGGRPRVHDTDELVWETVKDLPPGPIARRADDGRQATNQYVTARSAYHFRSTCGVDVTMHQLRHWLGTTVQRE